MDEARDAVIVVDDEPLIRMNAADVLAEAGYDVVEAPDAADAIRLIEQRPDLKVLFTDVNMPGEMDGMDLAREVHARWPKILLLVTSGRRSIPTDEIPDHGQFLDKPYEASQLLRRVERLLSPGAPKTPPDR